MNKFVEFFFRHFNALIFIYCTVNIGYIVMRIILGKHFTYRYRSFFSSWLIGYFIICNKGTKSRKAVSILEYYGYDVTQMSYE